MIDRKKKVTKPFTLIVFCFQITYCYYNFLMCPTTHHSAKYKFTVGAKYIYIFFITAVFIPFLR